ncbi:protein kinase-like domain, concanavalin A-like lectin/glucanase domain protein [Tanacetum coccineum]
MESANPSCSTSNREFLNPKKKEEIESWLGDSRIVDSFDGPNEIKYFDTFPTLEELEYHEWLLKYPKPSWLLIHISSFLDNIEEEMFPSVKYKIKTVDLENFIYSMAVMDDDEIESTLSEMKVIPSVDGGCKFIQKTTEYKGIDEDEIESQKEQVCKT